MGKRNSAAHNFQESVLRIVRGIPKGSTRTYAAVAQEAGSPGAARAVGTIMRKNYDPTVPCHRVIKSDGTVGAYNRGGSDAKYRLLTHEGVSMHGTRVRKEAS